MKQSIDDGFDDHPPGGEEVRASWAVAITDDCDECDDVRVQLTLEEEGRRGTGVSAHLSPREARRLRAALTTALRQLGQDPAG
jgi:hypothetical protein